MPPSVRAILDGTPLTTGARGPLAELGASAATDGRSVAFAEDRPSVRTVAHEAAHVAQYRRAMQLGLPPPTARVSHRDDPAEREAARFADVVARGGTPGAIVAAPSARVHRDDPPAVDPTGPQECRQVRTGTFHLDPGLECISPPSSMKIHVHVAPPATGSTDPGMAIDVELDRTVYSAERITAFVVSRGDVFEQPVAACSVVDRPELEVSSMELAPGSPAYTASGPINITKVEGDNVFVSASCAEVRAAAVAVLVHTDMGMVLIDGGTQADDPSFTAAAGYELGEKVMEATKGEAVNEAIATSVGPGGPALPYVALYVGITTIRATPDMYDDGTVSKILAAQQDYRKIYEEVMRDSLANERATWEATQPISPNAGVREKLWQAHLDELVTEAMKGAPVTKVAMADFDGITQREVEGVAPIAAPAPPKPGEVPSLEDVEWVPDDKAHDLVVYGGGRLTLFSAAGLVLKPKPVELKPQVATTVPQLGPTGPIGPAPAQARPATPWLMLPSVGKANMLGVRINGGHGILIDAGGPRLITTAALARMAVDLGGAPIEQIFQSHGHSDHFIAQKVAELGLDPSRVFISRAAAKTSPNMPGVTPVEATGTGTISLRIEASNTHIEILTRPDAHQAVLDASKPSAPQIDAASHVYLVGNESSPHRMLSIGDMRGDQITQLIDGMPGGEAEFKAKMKNVRVIDGGGHHFSRAAGQTVADVEGLTRLVRLTQAQNGQVTLLVQSSEYHSFGSGRAITTAGSEGALLKFFQRQGVRVVFAGSAQSASNPAQAASAASAANLDSNLGATTYGITAPTVIDGDPRVVAALDRLDLLREARRTVQSGGEHGAAALGAEGKTPASLIADLDVEIARLEGLQHELGGLAGAELLDARAGNTSGTTNRSSFGPGTRSEAQILADMDVKGPAETALTPDVVTRLRLAVASGRSIALDVEFAEVPRAMTEALESLSPSKRAAAIEKYNQLKQLVGKLENNTVQPHQQAEALSQAMALKSELENLRDSFDPRHQSTVDAEIARLDRAVIKLTAAHEENTTITRDNLGRIAKTRYLHAKGMKVIEGYHNVGRAMGALLVIHSVEELNPSDASAAAMTVPESVLRHAHAAYGAHIGLRMAGTTFKQAVTGSGARVLRREFAIHALLEVAATMAAEHETTEEHSAAVWTSAAKAGLNMGCMLLGEKVMAYSATSIPHPLAKAVGMGIGLAIMAAGELLFGVLELDKRIERWTGFPPAEVTHVNQEIGKTLNEYRIVVGIDQLKKRSEWERTRLVGKRDDLDSTAENAISKARDLESDLTTLFHDAYQEAITARVGLEMLDRQAAEFTRLRALALKDRPDPNHDALDARWREIDALCDLSAAEESTIRAMAQWSKLDEKIGELQSELDEDEPERKEALEHMRELQLMMDNARYRIASDGAGYRPSAMLPRGSPGYDTYVSLLQVRETNVAALNDKLLRLSGLSPDPTLNDISPDTGTALNRMRAIRHNYDSIVGTMAARNPVLQSLRTWEDPAWLTMELEKAHAYDPTGFQQLELAELTLEAAAKQVEMSMVVADPPTDDVMLGLAKTEIMGVRRAMQERRTTHGLVLPGELETVVTQRAIAVDKVRGANIDLAFDHDYSPVPKVPPSEEEMMAIERLGEKAWPGAARALTLAREIDIRQARYAPFVGPDADKKPSRMRDVWSSLVGFSKRDFRWWQNDDYLWSAAGAEDIFVGKSYTYHNTPNGEFRGRLLVPISDSAIGSFGAGRVIEAHVDDLRPVSDTEIAKKAEDKAKKQQP